jgi:hypothetical protein
VPIGKKKASPKRANFLTSEGLISGKKNSMILFCFEKSLILIKAL